MIEMFCVTLSQLIMATVGHVESENSPFNCQLVFVPNKITKLTLTNQRDLQKMGIRLILGGESI